ncbi:ABC transporter substrate-binding protein [Pelagibacterium xiamenense]|uniref:ABC transporter substrate-binding protein n=1 Tax=Pelagibacterium xiamenense TaxID=2901140 RepID=UPI001E550F35|nr:ABC transporter substrate-binding protein [Pelagibacterium xiamenense]MCD7059717.1 ABC transporter substrate-binding protein [Pelagibacterium xiamenense]
MLRKLLLVGTALAATGVQPALAQSDTAVTIVLNEEVDLMEPCMATRSNIGRVIMQNISETLTELDVRGDAGLMPRLAESWEDMGDGTWRFHLREGVTFSDGSAFDAADVQHSFERAFSDQISCETPRYFAGMELSFNVVDDHTIDITSDPAQPILPLLMTLVTMVPSETPVEFVREPVGTGPYVLSEWNVGQNITLTRRDDYWGEAPEVTEATYVVRSESAVRAAMVEAGEADIAPTVSEIEGRTADKNFAYPNSETLYLRLDHSMEPLSDIRVREALNLAIDREAFVGTLLPQGTEPAVAMVPPTTLGWNDEIEVWDYNPDRARELLEEARADGVDVDQQIQIVGRTNNYPNATEVYEAIQAMLTDVGFNVDLQMYEVAEFENIYSKPFPEDRLPQLVGAMHDNSRGDPVFSMFFKYHTDGTQSGLSDPRIDSLIEEATAASGEEREALWSELFAYIHDEAIVDVLLFHMVGFARVDEGIEWTPTIATNSQLQLSEISFN